jgi:hypothetical protein
VVRLCLSSFAPPSMRPGEFRAKKRNLPGLVPKLTKLCHCVYCQVPQLVG